VTDRNHWTLVIVALFALGWTLRETAPVSIPIAAAFLSALAVLPVSIAVSRAVPRGGQWLGPFCATAPILLLLLLFLAGISFAGREVIAAAPMLSSRIDEAVASGGRSLLGFSVANPCQLETLLREVIGPVAQHARRAAAAVAGGSLTLVATLFLLLLMLIEAPVWRAKLVRLSHEEAARWEEAFEEAAIRIRRFLWTRLLLGAATALLYTAYLWIFGIDLLFTWALLALLLNFIPTIGSIIAGLLPALYALATKDPGTALAVAGGLLVIEQIMGNYVDPRLMGHQLGLSPVIVLITLMVWGWIWGPLGAFLATPLTVLMATLCTHSSRMRPVGMLLGDTSNVNPRDP